MTIVEIFTLLTTLEQIYAQANAAIASLKNKRDEEWFKNSADLGDILERPKTSEDLKNASAKLASLLSSF